MIAGLSRRGYVKEEEVEEYTYGLNLFLTDALNLISMVAVGFLMRMPLECISFCLIYKLLRRYVGGFHTNSAVTCYISSCATYIVALLAIKYGGSPDLFLSLAALGAGIILFCIAPVDAVNKPLDNVERKVFKRRARLEIILILILCLGFLFTGFDYAAKVVAVSYLFVMIYAVMGKAKLMWHEKRKAIAV